MPFLRERGVCRRPYSVQAAWPESQHFLELFQLEGAMWMYSETSPVDATMSNNFGTGGQKETEGPLRN